MTEGPRPIVGIAWYRKDQWDELLRVSEDRSKLEASYGEWLFEAQTVSRRLRDRGLEVRRVDVDVEDLVRWCRERGTHVTAQSRASYVAEKVEKEGNSPGS